MAETRSKLAADMPRPDIKDNLEIQARRPMATDKETHETMPKDSEA